MLCQRLDLTYQQRAMFDNGALKQTGGHVSRVARCLTGIHGCDRQRHQEMREILFNLKRAISGPGMFIAPSGIEVLAVNLERAAVEYDRGANLGEIKFRHQRCDRETLAPRIYSQDSLAVPWRPPQAPFKPAVVFRSAR